MHGGKKVRLSQELRDAKLARDKTRIQTYNQLQDVVLKNKEVQRYDDKTLEQTTILLDMNPEFYTIWNYRRDILSHLYTAEDLAVLQSELGFILKQILKNPKCYWIWNHRIWCLKYMNNRSVYEKELDFVSQMLARDERNYHGWAYRRLMISALETFAKSDDELFDITVSEFTYTTKKINKDISNFSAWHNKSKLVLKVFEQQGSVPQEKWLFASKKDFVDKELEILTNAMFLDSDDSSIWIYMRWLISSDYFYDSASDKQSFLDKLGNTVKELNELERDDNGRDNEWCLKTLNMIAQSSSM